MRILTKQIILILGIIFFLACCMDDNYVKERVAINITRMNIPKSGQLNQSIEIQSMAEATNGCYRDLKITMTEIDPSHFLFTATGLYETYGACPEVMVYKDTTIKFQPTLTGKYYFQTNESPYEIKRDTLFVN